MLILLPAPRNAGPVASAYALIDVLGTTVVWFLPIVGPWLMRVKLRDASQANPKRPGAVARQKEAPRAARGPRGFAGSAAFRSMACRPVG